MKKSTIIIIIAAVLVVAALSIIVISIVKNNDIQKVVLVKDESYYSDFSVENNTVRIYCKVVLINNSDSVQSFKIMASFESDKGKLIKSSELFGTDNSTGKDTFTLNPGEKGNFNVVFQDEFAGTNQKHDRNLPEIEIQLQ